MAGRHEPIPQSAGITFSRIEREGPRITAAGSFLDREQIAAGEYYTAEISKS
jgi:ATP-binding cassette subfamily E protein 1